MNKMIRKNPAFFFTCSGKDFFLFALLLVFSSQGAMAQQVSQSADAVEHAADDAYWAELAMDYPPFIVNEEELRVAEPGQMNQLGVWGPVLEWPHIPVSAAHLPDGRILSWASNRVDGFPGGQPEFTYAAAWNPENGQFKMVPHNTHDMFCAHHAMLEDGRLLVAGGRNHVNTTSIYDFRTDTWTPVQNMNRGRWYPTAVGMPSGEVMIAIGSSGGQYPEVWSEQNGWRSLNGIDLSAPILNYSGHYERNWWPLLHVAPNGDVFHSGPTPRMHYMNIEGNGSIRQVGPAINDWYPKHGATVMFDEGLILTAGGAIAGGNTASTNRAMIVDIRNETPVVTNVPNMQYARKFQNGVMLPTGEVLIVGGNTSGIKFNDSGTVLAAEMYNPETNTWTTLADMAVPRNYHSVALLMTDGRVWSGGGGLCGSGCAANHQDAQVFSPPYLFNGDGSLAARPSINSAPESVLHGQNFTVTASANIAKFSLIKMSSTTHGVNSDVRYLSVPFSQSSNGVYNLTAHTNENVLTPGFWMLFAVDAQGVPSEAAVIQISTEGGPEIAYPGDQIGFIGQPFSFFVEGQSPGGFGLTYSASNLPAGLTINSSTGEISGEPASVETKTVTVTVTESTGAQASTSFSIQTDTSAGKVLREWWTGLPGGQSLDLLTNSPNYPDNPSGRAIDNQFESPSHVNDNYGVRMRAYFIPGATARYKFWIASDDNGRLLLSTDQDPANASQIAFQPNWASPREWDKYSEQESGWISLQAGQKYYIEALMKEGGGLDNLAVAFQQEGAGRVLLTSAWLEAYNPDYVAPPDPITVDDVVSSPKEEDKAISYTANATGGTNLRYKWFFGDGSAETAFSSSSSISHTFADPGRYVITLTVRGDGVDDVSTQFVQAVYGKPTANKPNASTSIIYEERDGANDRVWNVNPDNNTVSVLDAVSLDKVREIQVGDGPRTLSQAPDGRVWVVNKHDASVSIIDEGSLVVASTVQLRRASQPYAVVFDPAGNNAYISLEGTGQLMRLNPANGNQTGMLSVGPNPRHLSVKQDGSRVFVSRFITPLLPGEDTGNVQNGTSFGAEVLAVNASTFAVDKTIVLRHNAATDAEHNARGIPNYLGPLVIAPDGDWGWVPSKQDNVKRGALRDGNNLTHDSAVRSVSSRVNLGDESEDYPSRVDHDDASVPANAVFSPEGSYLFVALEGSRQVAVIEPYGAEEIARFQVERAPQGLTISPDGNRLFVHNFMERTVSVHDVSNIVQESGFSATPVRSVNLVSTEKLTETVLKGKQFFYDALDQRLALQSYVSCASCHNDGGEDGRVWDFTGFGEGLRNTISLNGKAGMGQGRLHWSGNFDEVQDFEGQIRNFAGGTGLLSNGHFNSGTRSEPLGDPKAGLSEDLDALAAYVSSLNTFADSPHRNADGTLTSAGEAGKTIFASANCGTCHGGDGFTDSPSNQLHDIGTIKPSSGNRLGQNLSGLDTPTLRGTWNTAPYLHDGSAATIQEAIAAHETITLSSGERDQLALYLRQIDGNEPAPNGNNGGGEEPVQVALGDHRFGVAAQDGASGVGYIMYTEESWRTRFSAEPLSNWNANHLVAVKYISGQWYYDSNKRYVAFTPRPSDRLLARINFGRDAISLLVGTNQVINDIPAGYTESDLSIRANEWNGNPNNGEFGVSGTYFEYVNGSGEGGGGENLVQVNVDPINQGIAAQDGANGTGYVMYTEESWRTRMAADPASNWQGDHLLVVRYMNGQWQYDTNKRYTAFTPRASDRLLAQLDFGADTVTMLEGSESSVNGIASGYLDGNIQVYANQWGGRSNAGEYDMTGSYFAISAEAAAAAQLEATPVLETIQEAPREFALHDNYPNPFNPQTTIGYDLAEPAQVTLTVYDIQGRTVEVLVDGHKDAGRYEAVFDATELASGLYLYRLQAGRQVFTRTMMLVK